MSEPAADSPVGRRPPETAPEPTPQITYRRESNGLEFDRVSFFSDAVYAIAMTLLVVELHVSGVLPDGLGAALREMSYEIFGFFLGFLIIGRFWLAHHQFFASLRSVDATLVRVNLLYLALVAFCPFPVSLISRYEGDPAAFFVFAATVGGISLLEAVMLLVADRGGHLAGNHSPRGVRFTLVMAMSPVVVILLSLPLALVSTTVALLSWLVMMPVGIVLGRFAPAELRDGRWG